MRFIGGTLVMLALLAAAPSSLRAHEEFRIIGTLTRAQTHQIDVKQKDNRTVMIKLDGETIVTRDKKKVPAAQLKSGLSVVVDALGDDLTDLVALEIRIVPNITTDKR